MNEIRTFRGLCPVLNREVEIHINYLDASTFDKKAYIKEMFDCPNGNNCDRTNNCPVYNNAPKEM